MDGDNLLNKVISATGLPSAGVQDELQRLVKQAGKSTENLTIDELRELLAEYLQEVLLSASETHSADT